MNLKFSAKENIQKNKEAKNLDAMIVVPAYDESIKILDTILHAVEQQNLKGSKEVSHGITVVVNGKPEQARKKDEQYLSNFQTYLLVQALAHKLKIKKTGDKNFDERVKKIQDTKVPIFVIDAFSEEIANENNNVGIARKIGYDFALSKVHPEGFIVSHDADSRLHKYCLSAVNDLLNMVTSSGIKYDAVSFGLKRHMDETTLAEKKAVRNHDLFWSIKSANESEDTDSLIEKKMVWMAGGGSAQTVRSILKTGGHKPVAGEEDTKLGISIVESGLNVVNGYDESVPDDISDYIQFSTRGRISERASTGYGRSISKNDEQLQVFAGQEIDSKDFLDRKNLFLLEVQEIFWEVFNKWLVKTKNTRDFDEKYLYSPDSQKDPDLQKFFIEKRKNLIEEFEKLLNGSSTGLLNTNIIGDNKVSSENISKLRDAFARYTPNIVSNQAHHDFFWAVENVFRQKYPPQTIKEYIDARFKSYRPRDLDHELPEPETFQGKTFLQTIAENPYGKVSSIADLRRVFFEKVRQILGDKVLIDENLKYKLLSIVVRNFSIISENIFSSANLFLKLAHSEIELEKERDTVLKLTINKDSIPYLYAFDKYIFDSALVGAVKDIQYFLEFDISPEEKQKLVRLQEELSIDTQKFFTTIIEPLQKNIEKNANKILVENIWDDMEVKVFEDN